jgi:hypothetical protein
VVRERVSQASFLVDLLSLPAKEKESLPQGVREN